VSAPRPGAPDFVKGRISIKVSDFLEFLSMKDDQEWLRIDIKQGFKKDEHGNPKWYSQVDNWVKPSERIEGKEESGDALPF
jgi:hypothetical protein